MNLTGNYYVYDWGPQWAIRISKRKLLCHALIRDKFVGIKSADWIQLMAKRGYKITLSDGLDTKNERPLD